MVLNPENSHFMCLGNDIDDTETLSFDDLASKNSKEVEIYIYIYIYIYILSQIEIK